MRTEPRGLHDATYRPLRSELARLDRAASIVVLVRIQTPDSTGLALHQLNFVKLLEGGPNPTFNNLASLASMVGGAILIGHSESGFFPENAALTSTDNIKGMITIEPGGSCTPGNPLTSPLSDEQIARLATIPTLIVYGDHLSGGFARSYENCRNSYVPRIEAAGGDITFISLPEMGIVGNSHMLMLDRNNLEIADIIIDWIENHASR